MINLYWDDKTWRSDTGDTFERTVVPDHRCVLCGRMCHTGEEIFVRGTDIYCSFCVIEIAPPTYDEEDEEEEVAEPLAWQTYEILTTDEGAVVYTDTNDNYDLGYPGSYAHWEMHFRSVEAALRHTGKSRVGVSGVRVTVTLDGVKQ